MARRSLRCLVALLTAATAAACDPAPSGVSTTFTNPSTMSSTSTTPTTAITPTTSTTPDSLAIDAEVSVPDGEGPFPAVVLVHGGGWVSGEPGLLEPLAAHLNDNAFLTVNTRYTLATLERPAYPTAVSEVACAVRLAASHPDSDGTVAVVGHSAGAHIGALVALTGDDYASGCTYPGSGVPDRFVGLAGPYDVSRLELPVAAFFGGRQERIPDVWATGNPQLLTDENTGLESLIMYGELDGLVPDSFAIDFHDALLDSGSESLLELVEGARHNEIDDPAFVGDLIVTWLRR